MARHGRVHDREVKTTSARHGAEYQAALPGRWLTRSALASGMRGQSMRANAGSADCPAGPARTETTTFAAPSQREGFSPRSRRELRGARSAADNPTDNVAHACANRWRTIPRSRRPSSGSAVLCPRPAPTRRCGAEHLATRGRWRPGGGTRGDVGQVAHQQRSADSGKRESDQISRHGRAKLREPWWVAVAP